ncbi:MAG TPA: phage tail protein [Kofleriaceae bacterium]|jgi:phage tail-like protein|nr:phage tail protein [Kofleriaceae bacterium]
MALGTTRSYAVSQFEFSLEKEEPFHVKSIEGGLPKGNVVEEQIGTNVEFVKHLSTVDVEPLSIELGMQEARSMLCWIQQSWNNDFCRKNGHVVHADFDYKQQFQYDFINALITETTFPTLDAAGKEMAMLKVKLQPEDVNFKKGGGPKLKAQAHNFQRQKMWPTSCFKFELEGVDTSHVAKIEGFTVKQGVKSYHTGRARYARWEPTKLTFPDLSVHVPFAYAGDLFDWYKESMDGAQDPSLQTTGSIVYLAPNKEDVVFEIELSGVGIKALTIDKSERAESVKRAKCDLYVSNMKLIVHGVKAW